MKFNIKKILICLLIFSCSIFFGYKNVLASTSCRYEIDFGEKLNPINNQLNNSDENFRVSFINMFRHGELYWFDEDEKRSKAYPTKIVVEINLQNGMIISGSYISLNVYFDGKVENKVFNIKDNDPDMITFETDTCPNSIRTQISSAGPGFIKYSIDDKNWSGTGLQYTGTGDSFSIWLINKNSLIQEKIDSCMNDLSLYGITASEVYDIFSAIPGDMRDIISKMNDTVDSDAENENIRKFIETFVNSPYLDYCSNQEMVVNTLTADASILEKFNKYFYSCIEKNKMDKDEVEVSGYSYDEINRLIFFLQKYGKKEQVKAICGGKEVSDVENEIENKFCTNWSEQGYSTKDDCVLDYEYDRFEAYSCEEIGNYAAYGKTEMGELEKNYPAYFNEVINSFDNCKNLTGEEKKNCVKNSCEKIQGNYDAVQKMLDKINKNVEEKKSNYITVMTNSYNDLVNISNIKADYKICDFLYGEKGLGPYINGAMNLVMIVGIIITIILSIMDGIKSFASFKDDESKKFFNNLKIRLICIALLIIIPTIINFLINIVGKSCDR